MAWSGPSAARSTAHTHHPHSATGHGGAQCLRGGELAGDGQNGPLATNLPDRDNLNSESTMVNTAMWLTERAELWRKQATTGCGERLGVSTGEEFPVCPAHGVTLMRGNTFLRAATFQGQSQSSKRCGMSTASKGGGARRRCHSLRQRWQLWF
jgi:hypothetical protein